jgi:hypothetical protein
MRDASRALGAISSTLRVVGEAVTATHTGSENALSTPLAEDAVTTYPNRAGDGSAASVNVGVARRPAANPKAPLTASKRYTL